jgi:hypothetical protein
MMTTNWIAVAMVVSLTIAAPACGGGDGGDAPYDAKRLPELTDAEKEQLCDWEAEKDGGYGKMMECSQGYTVKTSVDRAACLKAGNKEIFHCDFPVSQYKACIVAFAEDRCNLQILGSDKNCAPIFQCSLQK